MTSAVDTPRRNALIIAVRELSDSELANCQTNADALYKLADTRKRLNLDLELCARLDAQLVLRGKGAVFKELFEQAFDKALKNQRVEALEIGTQLRRLYVATGQVSASIDAALAHSEFSANELREISQQAGRVGRVALAIRDYCNRELTSSAAQ